MLYECHAHIMLDGVSQKDAQSRHANGPDESWVRAKLEEYKAVGVGYIRDGGKQGDKVSQSTVEFIGAFTLMEHCFFLFVVHKFPPEMVSVYYIVFPGVKQ